MPHSGRTWNQCSLLHLLASTTIIAQTKLNPDDQNPLGSRTIEHTPTSDRLKFELRSCPSPSPKPSDSNSRRAPRVAQTKTLEGIDPNQLAREGETSRGGEGAHSACFLKKGTRARRASMISASLPLVAAAAAAPSASMRRW